MTLQQSVQPAHDLPTKGLVGAGTRSIRPPICSHLWMVSAGMVFCSNAAAAVAPSP